MPTGPLSTGKTQKDISCTSRTLEKVTSNCSLSHTAKAPDLSSLSQNTWIGFLNIVSPSSVSRGVVSERYRLNKLSESEFTVSITDVTFRDGGIYTCYEYGHGGPIEKKVELKVLGEKNVVILMVSLSVTVKMNDLQYNDCCLSFN